METAAAARPPPPPAKHRADSPDDDPVPKRAAVAQPAPPDPPPDGPDPPHASEHAPVLTPEHPPAPAADAPTGTPARPAQPARPATTPVVPAPPGAPTPASQVRSNAPAVMLSTKNVRVCEIDECRVMVSDSRSLIEHITHVHPHVLRGDDPHQFSKAAAIWQCPQCMKLLTRYGPTHMCTGTATTPAPRAAQPPRISTPASARRAQPVTSVPQMRTQDTEEANAPHSQRNNPSPPPPAAVANQGGQATPTAVAVAPPHQPRARRTKAAVLSAADDNVRLCLSTCPMTFTDVKTQLQHVNAEHRFGGQVRLSAPELTRMKLQYCNMCYEVSDAKVPHPEYCAPAETMAQYADLRATLVKAVKDGSNPIHDLKGSHTLTDISWSSIQTQIISTFDVFPKAKVLKATLNFIFTLIYERITDETIDKEEIEQTLKLLFLLPAWLFQQPAKQDRGQPNGLFIAARMADLLGGQWDKLQHENITNQEAWAEKSKSAKTPADETKARSRRAIRLVAQGDISRASNTLRSTSKVQDANDPAVIKAISNLYQAEPRAPVAKFAIGPLDPSELIQATAVQKAITRSGRTGSGPSGLHISVLKALEPNAITALTKFMNTLLTHPHRYPEGVLTLLRTAALTPLSKPQGGTRPIAVQEITLRVMAKAVEAQEINIACEKLTPLQFGVGVAGGAEAVIHTTRAQLEQHPNFITLADDRANAYGNIHRKAVRDGMERLFPTGKCNLMRSYFNTFVDAPLYLKTRGRAEAVANDGLLQGDALSSVFFCLGYQAVLEATQAYLDEAGGGDVRGYMDDGTITASPATALAAHTIFNAHAEAIGCPCNTLKIKAVSINTQSSSTLESTQIPVRQVIDILGSPVGTPDAEAEAARQQVFTDIIYERISEIPDTQTRLLLLRHVIGHTGRYVARVVPPSASAPALKLHDGRASLLLAGILELEPEQLTPRIQQEAALPLAQGGLGIKVLSSSSSHDYLASSILAIQVIERKGNPSAKTTMTNLVQEVGRTTRTGTELAAALADAHVMLKRSKQIRQNTTQAIELSKTESRPLNPWEKVPAPSSATLPPQPMPPTAATPPTPATTTPPTPVLAPAPPAPTSSAAALHPQAQPSAPVTTPLSRVEMLSPLLPATTEGLLGMPMRAKLQQTLAKAHGVISQYAHLQGLQTDAERAQFLSKTGYGAAAPFIAVPSSPGLKLENECFVIALRSRLRIPIMPIYGIDNTQQTLCECSNRGGKAKLTEQHLLQCNSNRQYNRRHNAIGNVLLDMCRWASIPAQLEPYCIPGAGTEDARRFDINIDFNDATCRTTHVDITIRSPLSKERVASSARKPLWTAMQAAKEKREYYVDNASPRDLYVKQLDSFTPAVLETFGSMHPDFVRLIEQVCARMGGELPEDATWAAPTAVAYWVQQVEMAHWRHSGACINELLKTVSKRLGVSSNASVHTAQLLATARLLPLSQ